MTEQEQIIQNFKDKCEEIITKQGLGKTVESGVAFDVEKRIEELADDIFNRHSNMPNIDAKQLKEDLHNTAKIILLN